jgi:hypothetical protein
VLTLQNLLITVNPALTGSCDLGIGTSGSGYVIAEHNTIPVQDQALLLGDYATTAGGLRSFRANLVWRLPAFAAGAALLAVNPNEANCTGTPQDQISVAGADYNYSFNAAAGACAGQSGSGYELNLSAAAGAHDVRQSGATNAAGPNFADPYRNFLGWAKQNGSTGQIPQIYADALAQIKTMNDFTGATATYTIDRLMAWVRAGYTPQNPQLNFTYPGDTNAVRNAGAVAGSFGGLPAAVLGTPVVW